MNSSEFNIEKPVNEQEAPNLENSTEEKKSTFKNAARKFRQYVGPVLGATVLAGTAPEVYAAKNKSIEPAVLESTYNAPSETDLAKVQKDSGYSKVKKELDKNELADEAKIKEVREALTPKVLKDLQEKYDKKFKQEAREVAEKLLKDQERAEKKAKKDKERAEKEKAQEEAKLLKEQNKKLAKELEPQIIEAEKARFEEYKNAALSAIAKEREAEKIAEEKKAQEKAAKIKEKEEAKKEAEMREKLAPKVAEALRKKYQEALEKQSNK